MTITFDVEVRGVAESGFTAQTIYDRLAQGPEGEEREFLLDLLAKMEGVRAD